MDDTLKLSQSMLKEDENKSLPPENTLFRKISYKKIREHATIIVSHEQ